MYAIDWAGVLGRSPGAADARTSQPARDAEQPRREARAHRAVGQTVWALGFTSLLTDVSSEMVASILPLYLVLHLRVTPLAFGLIDGLYQGIAATTRLLSGVMADWRNRHKEVAASGYAISACCRLGLLAAGNTYALLAGIVVADRIGKGIRTAPRDALIVMNTPRRQVATAFGVHRALDAVGAMLGPIVAFGLLWLAPNQFDVVFVVSSCAALMGLSVLLLFVDGGAMKSRLAESNGLRTTVGLLGARPIRSLAAVSAILALGTISDGFIYLVLQRQVGFNSAYFPLLYVGTSLFNAAAAAPLGRFADRIGPARVYLGGYVLLLSIYTLLLASDAGLVRIVLVTALLGSYYAATDGILSALASRTIPQAMSASGLALLGTTQNLARLAASILFGWIWMAYGTIPAVATFGALLASSIGCSAVALSPTRGLEA